MKEILIERFVEANTGLCKIYEHVKDGTVFLERLFSEDAAWQYAEELVRKSGEEECIIYYKKVRHRCCKNCSHFSKSFFALFSKCSLNNALVCDSCQWCRDYKPKEGVL